MKNTKDELLNLIKESGNKGRSMIKYGSKIVEYGQYVADFADASESVVSNVTTSTNIDIDWNSKIEKWRFFNQDLDRQDVTYTTTTFPSSSASTVASCMLDFVNPVHFPALVSLGKEAEAQKAAINLGSVIDKLADKRTALKLLHEFGLSTTTPERKSPTELLETACAVFEKPAMPGVAASTSLLPMRECIDSTIAALLRRRPNQEKAGSHGEKICSIGKQLARSEIPKEVIDSMADRWQKLQNDLSGSKQKDISREEWRATLREAMLLLIEFLQSLDQTKMKK